VLRRLGAAGAGDTRVGAGGTTPPPDAAALRSAGVAAVFTPRDFGLTAIVGRIVDVIRLAHKLEPVREQLELT
jgi:ethylmalonyl-CoA mutase